MKVVIAGGHGTIARLTARRLVAEGHEVVGLVRNPDHVPDLTDDGAGAVVLDLEQARTAQVAEALAGADAVVFAAGAGPGSGPDRKDSVDRGAAVLLADAAELAGVSTYVLVSSMGVDQVRDGATPDGADPDDVFVAYLRAKLAAEEDVLARDALRSLVLRPGGLSDDPAAGAVELGRSVSTGRVPRDDVAAVLVELLGRAESGTAPSRLVVECVAGGTGVAAAVDAVLGGG